MPFPQGGLSIPKSGGTAVSSTTAKEGFTTEISSSLSSTARLLIYKFVPKYTGEYRITVDLKASANSVTLGAVSGSTVLTTGFASNTASQKLVSSLTPIGSTYTFSTQLADGYGEITMATRTGTTYLNLESFLLVSSLSPVYFILGSPGGIATVAAQNFIIYYDVK